MSERMEEGKYWVGDLCYVLDKHWDEVMQLMYPFGNDGPNRNKTVEGRLVLKNGVAFSYYGTAYGDGVYEDKEGNRYCVDAGLIGCVKWSDIPKSKHKDAKRLGHVHDFPAPFEVSYDEGTIRFGYAVSINTADDDESEYD
jgi:hypothetical protein